MKQLLWVFCAVALVSCQKEISDEILEPQPDESCIITRISQIDTNAQASVGYIGLTLDNDFRITNIVDYDSVNFSTISELNLNYVGDTVFTGSRDYFVLDPANNNRVRFSFKDKDQLGLSEDATFTCEYNAEGYLTQKVYDDGAEDVTIAYTWSGGNLTKILGTYETFLGSITFLEVDYTYTNIPVSNFLYLSGDVDLGYDLALNFGKRSARAPQSMRIRLGNDLLGGTDEYYTSFSNYVMQGDNRVFSFVVDNDELGGFGIYQGKNELGYTCR